jgi:hypothetical protein
MNAPDVRKSRKSLMLLLSVFVIPIVMAKLALDNDWFNEGVTNSGTLIEHELTLTELELTDDALQKKWLIISQISENCHEVCKQSLYGINQTFISLGKEMKRVVPVGLYATRLKLDATSLGNLKDGAWKFNEVTLAAKDQLDPAKVYVADPLGNIILEYPQPTTDQEVLAFGKAMLSDLRKLLKYSRIG